MAEFIDAFQFTNAIVPAKLVAIYAQQRNQATYINFSGIAAGIPLHIYLLILLICCLLVILFAVIEYSRPSKKSHLWDVATAILPCFNSQARENTPNNFPVHAKVWLKN
jgi:general stress protein CsbA